eukprot:4723088-Ditylum_brightwellii.AAC.1
MAHLQCQQQHTQKQLLGVFNDIYTSDLKYPLLGYIPPPMLQVLNHLYITWANITSNMLEEGTDKMKVPLDSTRPISCIWEQVQQGQALATAAGQAFIKPQLINTAYHTIFVSGLLMEACME